MKIKIKKNETKKSVEFRGKTLGDLFEKMNYWEENFVAVKDGKIILIDEKLKNNDVLTLYCTDSRG